MKLTVLHAYLNTHMRINESYRTAFIYEKLLHYLPELTKSEVTLCLTRLRERGLVTGSPSRKGAGRGGHNVWRRVALIPTPPPPTYGPVIRVKSPVYPINSSSKVSHIEILLPAAPWETAT